MPEKQLVKKQSQNRRNSLPKTPLRRRKEKEELMMREEDSSPPSKPKLPDLMS
jgi:hypothetical protein